MFAYKKVFCLGLALGVAAFAATANAQNAANGKTLYLANCNSCHGFPNYPLVQKGTASAVIQTAIASKVPKMNLPGLTGLTAANLADIAAYINSLNAIKNYQGLWWVPNGAENGWGINFAHQGDQIFATWYTYDSAGNPWWMSMLTARTSPTSNIYTGPVYVDTGPAFNNFVGSGTPVQVGAGTLTFTDADNGVLSYGVIAGGGNVQQVKTIQRFRLNGALPTPACTYAVTTAKTFSHATNYQDLWWVASGTESGWGINFAHEGNLLFATWYTYGPNNQAMWLSVLAQSANGGTTFTGPLLQTSGPRYDAYDKTKENPPLQVGTATFAFTNGNAATMSYTITGQGGLPSVTQSKVLSRFLFGPGAATICQ
jgi:hypothetical protein